jgi:hypothetical protein
MTITQVSEFVIGNNSITAEKLKVVPGTDGQVLAIDSSYNFYFTDLVSPDSIDDRVAALINAGTHTNITIVYDDINGSLSFSATGSVGSVNGQIGDVVLTSDDVSEGTSNLYFTNARARNAISVTDVSGDGSLSYNSSTGEITYTGPTATEVRAHFTGGTGVTITDGEISVGQDLTNTSNVTFNDINATGNVQIDGNLTVSGTTITISSENLAIADNLIYLNDGSTNTNPDLGIAGNYNDGTYHHTGFFRDATDGRWKIFQGYTPEPDTSIYIDTAHPSFELANFQANTVYSELVGNVTGTVSSISNHTTTDLTEGTNLYFTNTRARDAISVSGDLSYNPSTGVLSVTTYKSVNFNNDFATKTTTNLAEGTNLYFTNTRARNAISVSGDLSYNPSTGVLSVTTYKSVNFNNDFALKTTSDLAEGTNLYFTNERVDDRVAALLVAGSNITLSYNDVANTLTISSFTNGGYDLSGNSTDDLAEGTVNLYYTDDRVNTLISNIINDTAEYGSLTYNSLTDKIDYVSVTTSEIRQTISATNGVTYNSTTGVIELDSTASVEFVDMVLTGDLTVSGNTTFINTVELVVNDNIIILNAGVGPTEYPTLNSGIEINRGIENDVSIRWNEFTDTWQFTNDGIVYQNIGSLSASSTDDLAEGTTNLYYTDSRADARVDILRTELETSGSSSVHFNNLTNVPTVVKDVFTGNGTQTDFTLSATPGSPEALIVTMNGVTQTPGGDYTVSGTTISFVNPLPNGQVTIVRHVGYQVIGGITGSYLNISGGTMSGSILVDADNTYDLGTSTNQWRAVYGRTIEATYADLAERYESDLEYEVGTVVVFGGEKEITTTTTEEDVSVAGVISGNPAFKMNSQAGTDSTHPYIALRGRVLCKVIGPVKKGDLLVTSEVAGFAKSVGKIDKGAAVFAKSLQEDSSDAQKIIEVVII